MGAPAPQEPTTAAAPAPSKIKAAAAAVGSTVKVGLLQAGKTMFNTIIAVACILGVVIGGGLLLKACGALDPNETEQHEYQGGESKTEYKPSPELRKFLDEADSIIATYRKWLVQRNAK